MCFNTQDENINHKNILIDCQVCKCWQVWLPNTNASLPDIYRQPHVARSLNIIEISAKQLFCHLSLQLPPHLPFTHTFPLSHHQGFWQLLCTLFLILQMKTWCYGWTKTDRSPDKSSFFLFFFHVSTIMSVNLSPKTIILLLVLFFQVVLLNW